VVFERDVSDLFFSSVPTEAAQKIASWPIVAQASPVLFGIVPSAGHPIVTCFGVTAADARIRNATWLAGDKGSFGQNKNGVVLGQRAAEFMAAALGSPVEIGHSTFQV